MKTALSLVGVACGWLAAVSLVAFLAEQSWKLLEIDFFLWAGFVILASMGVSTYACFLFARVAGKLLPDKYPIWVRSAVSSAFGAVIVFASLFGRKHLITAISVISGASPDVVWYITAPAFAGAFLAFLAVVDPSGDRTQPTHPPLSK